ncbi:hypothetical protein PG999_008216 [Apiospora kogelbergensis]|uniref:Thaumatin family protein n=2 Tax=Apiospora kogelbergensis TaxID=1337665 RepID=A0AAW0QTK6_9PEZI
MVAALTTSLFITFASSALASAVLPAVTGVEGVIPPGMVTLGPRPTPPPEVPDSFRAMLGPGPKYVTITITNKKDEPISTSHARDPNTPKMVSGNANPGVIPAGGRAEFAVPTGWIGSVAITPSRFRLTNDITLIEANYVVPGGYSYAVADVDVSFVNGFSVTTVCSCSGKGVTGCNKNLWDLNKCPNDNKQGGCVNPLRADKNAREAAPFFRPCQHAAWTYVEDGAADAWGSCQSGHITCCVGPKCAPNPKQS